MINRQELVEASSAALAEIESIMPEAHNYREMPKYQCHKIVHGLRIAGIEVHQDRSATIAPADGGFAPLVTSAGWADRFKVSEEDLGYYVVYKDGYTSWSPTKEFEEGYTRI